VSTFGDRAHAPAPDHGHDHEHGHGPDHGEHDHGDHDHDHGPFAALRHLIAPHSHDAADKLDTVLESSSKGIHAVKVSLLALGVTAIAQLALVFATGSMALLADTIHNFSDALTAIPLWIAFVLGRRAANRRYTFGYRRAEDLAGLFIVAMITLSAILAAWGSIDRLMHPQQLSNIGILIAAGFVGFLGNEVVAQYRIRVGKQIGSAALVADGYHARTDGFTSLAVVAGALGVAAGFPQADPIVGLLISGAILLVLKDAVTSVFGRLMDAVDPAIVEQVEQIARGGPDVQGVDSVRVRWSGHRMEAILHVVVDCDLTIAEGHAIAEQIRHDLVHGVKSLDRVTVHVDPCGHGGVDHHAGMRDHDSPASTASLIA
jgi:cation diffusion facilitator family transporter